MEIFQYGFMIRAFAAGLAVAALCPIVGSFLVLRRYSLLADTLAHVALTGVAIGLLTRSSPIVMAVITTVIAAFLIERLRSTRKIYGESVLAIFLSGSLAIAVILIGLAKGFNASLFEFLFGTVVAVSRTDLVVIWLLAAAVTAGVAVLFRELLYFSVDEDSARVSGIKTSWVGTFLLVAAAVTVSLSIRVVGVLLVGALMVIPVVTAFLLSKSFRQALAVALSISVSAVIAGLFVAYYLNLAAGGSIVLITLLVFLAAVFVKKR